MRKSLAKVFLILSLVALTAVSCGKQQDSQQQQGVSITVMQAVEGGRQNQEITFKSTDNKTGLDLLKDSYKVETKQYQGIGEFVESIDGRKADSGKTFWAFLVNGKLSPVGASQYHPQSGDKLEWKLENMNTNL